MGNPQGIRFFTCWSEDMKYSVKPWLKNKTINEWVVDSVVQVKGDRQVHYLAGDDVEPGRRSSDAETELSDTVHSGYMYVKRMNIHYNKLSNKKLLQITNDKVYMSNKNLTYCNTLIPL